MDGRSGMRTRRALAHRIAGIIGAALLSGLGARRLALGADGVVRRRIPLQQPGLELSPREITIDPGTRVVFTAVPSGGGSIALSVDWAVIESDQGGTVAGDGGPQDDGSFTAVYTAPDQGGPFHVVASLHQLPEVQAVATVSLRPG